MSFEEIKAKQNKKLKILRAHFEKFLGEKEALEKFRNNLPEGGMERCFSDAHRLSEPKNCIHGAFNWASTPEDSDYWVILSREWAIHYDKVKGW